MRCPRDSAAWWRGGPGERFLKDVYEAVRAGPAWNRTLLFVGYDDAGGFYDSVVRSPPLTFSNLPPPLTFSNLPPPLSVFFYFSVF